MHEFQIGETTYQAKRFTLREWLSYSEIQEKIINAVEREDIDDTANHLCSYLSTALGFDTTSLPWFEVVSGYIEYTDANKINERLPILREIKHKFQDIPAWEYEGRTFYWWVHVLGKHYGWSMEYISVLDMDDAIALMQEIIIDEQLKREWEWSLTEIAYPYNDSTKKSEFKPLPRPKWMTIPNMIVQPKIDKIKIHRDLMPKGIVVSYVPDEPIIN